MGEVSLRKLLSWLVELLPKVEGEDGGEDAADAALGGQGSAALNRQVLASLAAWSVTGPVNTTSSSAAPSMI